MEVEGPTEITPNNSTGGTNVNNNGGSTKDVNNFVHLPFNPDLVDVHRVSSSGQRIKLQVEVNSDYKFLTICDPASSLADLKTQLELEYAELYPTELPIVIVRLQDSRRNDMPQRFKVGDLLRDKDKIYIVMKPIISEDDSAEANTPAPRQRGRKRKNMDKDIKQDTPNKKLSLSSLSPTQLAQLPHHQQHSPSQPPTPTHQIHQLHQQQLQQGGSSMGALISYSPGAKVPLPSQNAERVMCNPYCALIETRDNVPCTHCGELRPYVVPDSEKTDRNQCSKWCVTGSTRKLKAAGLEFCSICLARHRAGKYDLRKSHQCQMCHRPWLHLDEYLLCRTCRKSTMGSDKEPTQIPAPIILNNPLSILSGNGTPPLHMSQQPLPHAPQLPPLSSLTHQQSPLLTHPRTHSPPPQHHISLLDFHKRSEHDAKMKGEQKNTVHPPPTTAPLPAAIAAAPGRELSLPLSLLI
eukprot:Phypoly_transcript_06502.p1 GENE.Phypoly_transcript_06502~~Phypoly_transcript_06502.p1  ORF type:complete len:466 (+),score=87.53 Phypoly_transcript_06502:2-1399(+)